MVLSLLHLLINPSSYMGQELLYTAPDTIVVWSVPRDASEIMVFCCAVNQIVRKEFPMLFLMFLNL